MFHSFDAHSEYHEKRRKAALEHAKRLREADLISEPIRFECQQSPMDYIKIMRIGPKDCPATFVRLSITEHDTECAVALSAREARRLAGHLLELADEVEPYKHDALDESGGGGER